MPEVSISTSPSARVASSKHRFQAVNGGCLSWEPAPITSDCHRNLETTKVEEVLLASGENRRNLAICNSQLTFKHLRRCLTSSNSEPTTKVSASFFFCQSSLCGVSLIVLLHFSIHHHSSLHKKPCYSLHKEPIHATPFHFLLAIEPLQLLFLKRIHTFRR